MANAALIVQAVNAHGKLVEMVKRLQRAFSDPDNIEPVIAFAVMEQASALLAELEGKE